MLVYVSTKDGFYSDVTGNRIEQVVHDAFRNRLGHSTSRSEISAWSNSMLYMNNVLHNSSVPGDTGVAIEYRIPQTSKRIDFILTGKDANKRDTAIIVELKQWSEVEPTAHDGIVATYLRGALCETPHPSYQAWTYAALLQDFNEAVYDGDVTLQPCAYLHNCSEDSVLNDARYRKYTKVAPVYLKQDSEKLSAFISTHVRQGDRGKLLYRIDQGRIRPSKDLADCLASLLKRDHSSCKRDRSTPLIGSDGARRGVLRRPNSRRTSTCCNVRRKRARPVSANPAGVAPIVCHG